MATGIELPTKREYKHEGTTQSRRRRRRRKQIRRRLASTTKSCPIVLQSRMRVPTQAGWRRRPGWMMNCQIIVQSRRRAESGNTSFFFN